MRKTALMIFLVLCMALTVLLSSCFDEESYYTKTETEALVKTLEGQVAELLNEPTYTVTFDLAGGEGEIPQQSVKDGKKVIKPADPTRAGHTFLGWFVGDEEWSFIGYSVTESVTLTARWSHTTHSYIVKSTTPTHLESAATCQTPETYYYKCVWCSEHGTATYTVGGVIPHSYTVKNTSSTYQKSAATCTTPAEYYYKCTMCTGHSTESFTSGGALSHSYTAKDTSTTYRKSAATCTSAAVYYYKCVRCAEHGTNTFTSGSALPHDYTAKSTESAYVKTAPTCQSVGVYYYKCATCTARGSATYTGDTLGTHSFTSKTQTISYLKSAANCDSPAVYYYKCAHCTAKGTEADTYTVGTEKHNFAEKLQTAAYLKSAATCESPTVYYYKCTLCDGHGTDTYTVGTKKHNLAENNVCRTCFGSFIYFGEYPQTLKAEGVTITSTTDSRGYYLGSDGAYYAKVTANAYYNDYTFSDGSTVTDGTVYYFKVEPICWRILFTDGESAFILCDSIIANKAFDGGSGYNNNYAESDVRAWLNAEFYNTAFTALEKELILTTTVDNSVASTGYSSNPYACEDTADKVFLLSYAEVTNSAYGFSSSDSSYDTARRMQTSDYSRATGAYMSTSAYDYGNGCWLLRSPYYYNSYCARYVNVRGCVDYNYVYIDSGGVVPALQIKL